MSAVVRVKRELESVTEQQDIRAILMQERAYALERVAKLEEDLNALTRARRGESDDDEHDPEGETLSAQWSMRAGLLENARDTLRLAEAAVERLEEGTYGDCKVCGGQIPAEQLEVRPYREECVRCAS